MLIRQGKLNDQVVSCKAYFIDSKKVIVPVLYKRLPTDLTTLTDKESLLRLSTLLDTFSSSCNKLEAKTPKGLVSNFSITTTPLFVVNVTFFACTPFVNVYRYIAH